MADFQETIKIVLQGVDMGAFAAATTMAEKIDIIGARGMKAADAIAILNAAETAAADAQKQAAASADDLGTATEGAGQKASNAASLFSALKSVIAFLGVAELVKDFVDANIQFERTEQTLKAVTGNSADAAKEFDYVRDVANRLGLEINVTANAYAQLMAASKGTQLEGQPTREIFEAVAGAMATLGKSAADTNGALIAITQMISKGTVQAEELRGQLGDRLPGAFNLAAQAMGVSTAELNNMLKAGEVATNEFLPKFADALNKQFGAGGEFDTYQAQVNRLKNELNLLFVQIGESGVIDAMASRLKDASTKLDEIGSSITATKTQLQALWEFLKGNITWDNYIEIAHQASDAEFKHRQAMEALATGAEDAAEKMRLLRQEEEARAAIGEDQSSAETKRLARLDEGLAIATGDSDKLNASLKALGLDPKKFESDISDIGSALHDLLSNPAVRGDEALAGLEAALKRVRTNGDFDAIAEQWYAGYSKGTISEEIFTRGMADLSKELARLDPNVKIASDSIEKQSAAIAKADKAAQDYQLKLEELASNERIKTIEAKVKLDVANVEANAKIAQAAFDSINSTIKDTGDQLGTLFKLFGDNNLSWDQFRKIEDQIDLENKRRDDALALQKRLVEAQIAQIAAQTKALDRSDAIIKIDGAGLQPHLEAFMFEILRSIQTRVNAQGLDLLLGVPIV